MRHPWRALLPCIYAMILQAELPMLRRDIDAEICLYRVGVLRCFPHTLVEFFIEYSLARRACSLLLVSRSRIVVCRPEHRCEHQSRDQHYGGRGESKITHTNNPFGCHYVKNHPLQVEFNPAASSATHAQVFAHVPFVPSTIFKSATFRYESNLEGQYHFPKIE